MSIDYVFGKLISSSNIDFKRLRKFSGPSFFLGFLFVSFLGFLLVLVLHFKKILPSAEFICCFFLVFVE